MNEPIIITINCIKCHEAIEVPAELIGNSSTDAIEYICESCEPEYDEDDYDDLDVFNENGESDFVG